MMNSWNEWTTSGHIIPVIHGWFRRNSAHGQESMRPVVRKAMEIMDGIQLWWLREPEVDLCAEWAEMENLLFPEPLWDAYR